MEVNICGKFKILFWRIFEEEHQISRYYSEKLLKCLADPNDHVAKHLLDTPTFSDLIFNCIKNIQKLTLSNKIFILQTVAVLFRNELQFNKLQCQGLDINMLKNCVVSNLNSETPSAELHLAFIKLATVLLSHGSGMKLVISQKPWERTLHPGLHRKPAYLTKAVYEYLTKLVWKLDEYEDETTLYEVLRAILKPIHESEYQTLKVFDTEKEKSYSESVIAPLHVLLAIMNDTGRLIHSKIFVPILKHCYFIEAPMPMLLTGARDPDIICLVSDINFKYYLALISQVAFKAGKSDSDFLNEVIVCFVNAITMLQAKKQMVTPILEFLVNINIFWAKTGSKIYTSTFERNGLKHDIEDQFLWHLMLPTITYAVANVRATSEETEEYNAKMGQMLTEHITKSGYRFRSLLQRHDLKKITIQNVKQVFKLKGLLKAKQAGTLFQTMFYLLQTFITREDIADASGVTLVRVDCPLQTSDDAKLLSLALAAIKMLLTEHNINWYDNLEIICVQNALMDLMKQNALPTTHLLQALDLIELSTVQFLSPDMTLLMESRHGSALCDTTAAMRRYIQHADWEVRDSALSLLRACTEIAFIKYVPLQKLILENELIVLASQTAISDEEYYVQATALMCLAAAAKIESLWRMVLNHNASIYKHLIHILRHSPEGAVRTAAATALTQVYIHQHTSKTFHTCMCDVMESVALNDLHWEVQLAALDFWKQVIRNILNDRGMLDGKFPSVTFSKEKRKIIVLDEKEVKIQLSAIMHDLSANGCLTVLSRCITEEYNIEVMKRSHCITNKLVTILTCHNFDRVPDGNDSPVAMDHSDTYTEPDTDVALDLTFVPDNTAMRDNLIDEILNTKTSDLIMKLNSETATVNSDMEQDIVAPLKERIHPNTFLENFKRTDYVTIINNIKNWRLEPKNLNDLLDEILGDTNFEVSDYCIE